MGALEDRCVYKKQRTRMIFFQTQSVVNGHVGCKVVGVLK